MLIGVLILIIISFAGCETRLCHRTWDDGVFRCMTDDEICKERAFECEK